MHCVSKICVRIKVCMTLTSPSTFLTPFNENDCFVFTVQGALVRDNLVTLLRTTWKPKQMSEI